MCHHSVLSSLARKWPQYNSSTLHRSRKGTLKIRRNSNQPTERGYKRESRRSFNSRNHVETQTHCTAQYDPIDVRKATPGFSSWCSIRYSHQKQTHWCHRRPARDSRWMSIPKTPMLQCGKQSPDDDNGLKCNLRHTPKPEPSEREENENPPALATNLKSQWNDSAGATTAGRVNRRYTSQQISHGHNNANRAQIVVTHPIIEVLCIRQVTKWTTQNEEGRTSVG